MKNQTKLSAAILVLFFTASAFAGVTVTSPINGSTVNSNVTFAASATTTCSKGIASMGIYPETNQLAYVVKGSQLNTSLNLNPGTYNVTVQEWDNCGSATKTKVAITVTNSSGVWVVSPANNSKMSSSVNYVATATTTCSAGVSAMGIYNNSQLVYTVSGASLSHTLSLSPGTYQTTVKEWDKCGGSKGTGVTVTVTSSGKTFYNIQRASGWQSYGQQPPSFVDCTSCSGLTWAMNQNISSPSLSGNATQYVIGGTTAYSDVLWLNHLIGPFSSQGLPDTSETIVPSLHDFTYDIEFWGNSLTTVSNALEFDINQYFNGMGFIWGLECRMWSHQWALWDSYNKKWTSTSLPCTPVSNAWNHLVFDVERTSSNQLLYKTVTLNGVTQTINQTFNHFSVSGWYGLVVNYQMDGNSKQTNYSTYVDQLNLTYQ